jgi:hypothetical protein
MPKKVLTKKESTTKPRFVGHKTVEEKIEELTSSVPVKETPPAQVLQVVEVEDAQAPVDPVAPEVVMPEEKIIKEEENVQEKPESVVSEFYTKQKEEQPSLGYPNISEHRKGFSFVYLWALGVIAIVVAIGFGIVATSRGSVKFTFIRPTPTPSVAPAPLATPTPAVNKKTISIEILNGSGIAGVAGKMKTLLESKGYTVAGTGNAKTYDYEKTEIQTKEETASYSAMIAADISGSYMVGSTSATLKSTLPYDAVVIVGKE